MKGKEPQMLKPKRGRTHDKPLINLIVIKSSMERENPHPVRQGY